MQKPFQSIIKLTSASVKHTELGWISHWRRFITLTGKRMEYDSPECWESEMLPGNKRLLMRKSLLLCKFSICSNAPCSMLAADHRYLSDPSEEAEDVRKCPYIGRFPIETGTNMCSSFFRSGCNTSSIVDIISSCSSKPGEAMIMMMHVMTSSHIMVVVLPQGYNLNAWRPGKRTTSDFCWLGSQEKMKEPLTAS